jgi:2-succinyl-5-enolpyruvyl-6-hydroxy-3-cyclohexene-1-carboxylate synthase
LINNGKGTEFRNYDHPASQFGDDADRYIAAGGHFGMQSPLLVKAYVEALGFKYLRASNKESFINAIDIFMDPVISESPLLFEVFTSSQDESEAIRLVRNIVKDERTFTERLHDKAKSLAHRLTK